MGMATFKTELQKHLEKPLSEGDSWYLIDNQWFKKLKKTSDRSMNKIIKWRMLDLRYFFPVTQKYELIEPLLIFTICYVSYLVAEMMELSAILAIIFCAFVMMHRVDKRLSKDSHVVIRNGLKGSRS